MVSWYIPVHSGAEVVLHDGAVGGFVLLSWLGVSTWGNRGEGWEKGE